MDGIGPVGGAGYSGGVQGPSPYDKEALHNIVNKMDQIVHDTGDPADLRMELLQGEHDNAIQQMKSGGFSQSTMKAMDAYFEQSMRMVDGTSKTPIPYDAARIAVEAKIRAD